jgi:nicotinamide mononucleotide (NMN) deamidase PncC
MKKLAKKSKLQLDRETIQSLNQVSEEVTKQVAGGHCTAAATTCATCTA